MLRITQATPADLTEIVNVLREMSEFYGNPDPESGDSKAGQISAVLFADNPKSYLLLAYYAAGIAGFASYSYLWPAVLTSKSLYMKELYVVQGHRRRGIGAALMREIFSIADQNECSRVEWTTDLDNAAARKFYESMGYSALSSKIFYRAEDFGIATSSRR